MQEPARIRPDLKVTKELEKDLKAHRCTCCGFDGSKPVKIKGEIKNFPKGMAVEYETRKSPTVMQLHAHCPACGFWDHESFTKSIKAVTK